MKIKKIKKQIKKILKLFCILIVAVLLLYSLIYNFNDIFLNKPFVQIGNFGIFTEDDDESMKPLIKNSDLIITKKENINDIKNNDIIAYYNENSITENIVKIQKVITKIQDNGRTYIITRGQNNLYVNTEKIKNDEIIGTVTVKIPVLGWFLKILQTRFILIIYLGIIFLIGYFKYKKEKEIKEIIAKQDEKIKRRISKIDK